MKGAALVIGVDEKEELERRMVLLELAKLLHELGFVDATNVDDGGLARLHTPSSTCRHIVLVHEVAVTGQASN